ncbi:MAG: hypothetical protein WCQ50_16915 [Spirochaetota bacterium]
MIERGSMPEDFGFSRFRLGGHRARSIMSAELRLLFAAVPEAADAEEYGNAIINLNVLGKDTASNRGYSHSCLKDFYALDPRVPLFRGLRRVWQYSSTGHSLLAFQTAFARDSIVRQTSPLVLGRGAGMPHLREEMEAAIREQTGGEYSDIMICSVAKNLNSSWTQAGYLEGKARKRRIMPDIQQQHVAFALFVAYLDGWRGQSMFSTNWLKLLGLPEDELLRLAEGASRSGILRMMSSGGVIEFRFPGWLTSEEEARLNG